MLSNNVTGTGRLTRDCESTEVLLCCEVEALPKTTPDEAEAEGRRPEGEGANIDRRLVPYHGKSRRIQSRIEFIYLYIYMSVHGPFCDGVRRLGTG